MGRSVIRIESKPGPAGGIKDAVAQPHRPGCRIARQVQMAVQIGVFNIGTRQGKVKTGGNAQRRLVHAPNHHLQVGGVAVVSIGAATEIEMKEKKAPAMPPMGDDMY